MEPPLRPRPLSPFAALSAVPFERTAMTAVATYAVAPPSAALTLSDSSTGARTTLTRMLLALLACLVLLLAGLKSEGPELRFTSVTARVPALVQVSPPHSLLATAPADRWQLQNCKRRCT
jgi:hypothetical protein